MKKVNIRAIKIVVIKIRGIGRGNNVEGDCFWFGLDVVVLVVVSDGTKLTLFWFILVDWWDSSFSLSLVWFNLHLSGIKKATWECLPSCLNKDLFDWGHNSSHLTLYPDVLKIKTIIVVLQKISKMPFVYYLQIHFWLLCSLDVLAAGVARFWIFK